MHKTCSGLLQVRETQMTAELLEPIKEPQDLRRDAHPRFILGLISCYPEICPKDGNNWKVPRRDTPVVWAAPERRRSVWQLRSSGHLRQTCRRGERGWDLCGCGYSACTVSRWVPVAGDALGECWGKFNLSESTLFYTLSLNQIVHMIRNKTKTKAKDYLATNLSKYIDVTKYAACRKMRWDGD